ncbi:MAG: deoxyribonuclease V [Pseudomonadota bacterium]
MSVRRFQAHAHRWDVTPTEAVALQNRLREYVITDDALDEIRTVAGVDVGFEAGNTVTRAAIAVLQYHDLSLIEGCVARVPTAFPYVPGLLSFRELPAVLKALEALSGPPDLVVCDGQGYAHPRRLGIASHLGVYTGLATIGVAKKRLIGQHEEVPDERGAWRPLIDKGETIGAVLRTRAGVKPVYVSAGYRVSLPRALECVMHLLTRYRLPETTRWAHRLASGSLETLPPEVRARIKTV